MSARNCGGELGAVADAEFAVGATEMGLDRLGLRNSWLAASRTVAPLAMTCVTRCSWGVRWSAASGRRGRVVTAVASSSRRARSAQGAISSCSNKASAVVSCVRASGRRRVRRRPLREAEVGSGELERDRSLSVQREGDFELALERVRAGEQAAAAREDRVLGQGARPPGVLIVTSGGLVGVGVAAEGDQHLDVIGLERQRAGCPSASASVMVSCAQWSRCTAATWMLPRVSSRRPLSSVRGLRGTVLTRARRYGELRARAPSPP